MGLLMNLLSEGRHGPRFGRAPNKQPAKKRPPAAPRSDLLPHQLTIADAELLQQAYEIPGRVELPAKLTTRHLPAAEPAIERFLWLVDERKWKQSPPSSGCLERFIELTDGSLGKILAFAREWGPLGICGHNKPAGHQAGCAFLPAGRSLWCWEPAEAWRRYARQLRGILDAAAYLNAGQRVSREIWAAIAAGEPQEWLSESPGESDGEEWPLPPAGAPAAVERAALAECITNWMRYGQLELHFAWVDHPDVRLHWPQGYYWPGLPGVLAAQLVTVVRAAALHVCSRCGHGYQSVRKPRFDKPAYCPVCRGQQELANKRNWKQARDHAKKQEREDMMHG